MEKSFSFPRSPLTALWVVAALVGGCGGDKSESAATRTESGGSKGSHLPKSPAEIKAALAQIDKDYPLHGLVTGLQLVIRSDPKPDAMVLGWLRIGARVRLKRDHIRGANCRTGFYAVHPRGWACAGEGIRIGASPPPAEMVQTPPPDDAALPYHYYFVKDALTPEYHRLPSRKEQEAMLAFIARHRALRAQSEEKADELLQGKLPNEPAVPQFVRRFLQRGFYVAGTSVVRRGARMNFVQTVRGRYIWEPSLEERTAPPFHGVELGKEHQLPIAWAVRAARPLSKKVRKDETVVYREEKEELIERHAIVGWRGREWSGTRWVHAIDGDRYLHPWFLAVAELMKKPRGIRADEPWIHIDRGEQTLVLYIGATPIYATLVSTGLPEHETPVGEFNLRAKHIADTMSDIGADAKDDRYSIEDVPWTQYFRGSLAIHGAFWHDRFGLQRSHGCVNVSPLDAHFIFNHTWPELPSGWHGISAKETGVRASHVFVTD